MVSTTFEVTAYRTLWLGLQHDSETVEQGAEIVHELILAIELGATADQFAETMHIHPTLPESINSAAGGVHKPS